MILYDVKQFFILYRLQQSYFENNFITSDQLAEELSMTSRTIKNMMIELNDYSKNKGFIITSKKGNGYSIEIINQSDFELFRNDICRFFNKYNPNICPHEIRSIYICLYLMQISAPTTIEKLKSIFFLSTSTIYNDLVKVKKIVKNGITLQTNQGKMVYITGREEDIRNRIIFLYNELLYSDGIQELFHDPYYLQDKPNQNDYEIFTHILNKYNITVSNESFDLIVHYLKLANRRFLYHKRITLNKNTEHLIQLNEYHCAKELLEKMHLDMRESEDEIKFVALLLLFYNNKHFNSPERYGFYYNELIDFNQYLKEMLNLRFNGIFHDIKDFDALSFPIFTKLFFVVKFHMEDLAFDNINYRSEMITNQIYHEISRSISDIIYFKYAQRISVSIIQIVSFHFSAIFNAIEKEYGHINILVIPRENENYWPYIMNNIQKTLPYQPTLDFSYEYQIGYYDLNKYDFILTDYNAFIMNSSVPVISFDIESPLDFNFTQAYYQKLKEKTFNFDEYLHLFKNIYIHENYVFEGISDMLLELQEESSYCLPISPAHIKEKNIMINYYSKDGIVVIPNITENKDSDNLLFVYTLSSGTNPLWRDREIKHIIFFNMDLCGSLKNFIAVTLFVDYVLNHNGINQIKAVCRTYQ